MGTAIKNGVDVEALGETLEELKKNPDLGESHFRIKNTWKSGGNNHIEIKGFFASGEERKHDNELSCEADEPHVLFGSDHGANPVEYLLAALSSCMTTTIVYGAAGKGYEINSLESEFEGDLDVRGFLQIDDSVPIGYQKIKTVFTIDTDAPEEELHEFYKFSPVYSMVSKAVPIEVTFKKP